MFASTKNISKPIKSYDFSQPTPLEENSSKKIAYYNNKSLNLIR